MTAFKALYDNKNGLQDKFVDFWNVTSKALGSNPYVVGYDPLNEPFPGNPAKDFKNALPGHVDKTYLAPMYEKFYEKYQEHNEGSLMWFEPIQVPDSFGLGPKLPGLIFDVGFETPPGGEIGSPYHVLNDHTYCCTLGLQICATGEPSTEFATQCASWHNKRLHHRNQDAERLGLPLFISEFGACLTEDNCT